MEQEKLCVFGVVIAAFIFRPDGRVFFVKRKGKAMMTFPTGGVKLEEYKGLTQALFRETKEEVFGRREFDKFDIRIREVLDVYVSVRPEEDGSLPKLIVIYVCDVDDQVADKMAYEEGDETIFIWLDPKLACRLPLSDRSECWNLPLDDLAKEGLGLYLLRKNRELVLSKKKK